MPLKSFVKARFARGEYLGLHLTIGFLVSALALWILLGITKDVRHNDPITQLDSTLLDWMQIFRALSALGSPLVMMTVAVGVAVFLVISKQRLMLEGWLLAVGGGLLLNNVVKNAIHRPRPHAAAGLYQGWSFPSGHAMGSLIVFGMLAYLLILLGPRNRRAQVAIVGGATLLILAIGLSRLYLGAHYFSDVVGGYAAGMLWLSACISGLEVTRRWRAT